MKAPPIFLAGASTPEAPTSAGISVAPPLRRGRAIWLHGVLAVDETDREGRVEQWLRSLFVTCVTEVGCVAQTASVALGRAYLDPPAWTDSRTGILHLPFHFDVNATLRFPLPDEPVWAHVAARDLCSEPVRIDPPEAPDARVTGAVDELIFAYSRFAEGDPRGAAEYFARALGDEALRRDLDGAHLFHAACAAAQTFGDDTAEPAWLARALEWTGEDLQRRAQRVSRLTFEAVGADEFRGAQVTAALGALSAHFDRVRADPALAPLRARHEYAALFA